MRPNPGRLRTGRGGAAVRGSSDARTNSQVGRTGSRSGAADGGRLVTSGDSKAPNPNWRRRRRLWEDFSPLESGPLKRVFPLGDEELLQISSDGRVRSSK